VSVLNVWLSINPWVPPPQEILKGTPTCFCFSVFNLLGIISSNSESVKTGLPFTKIVNVPVLKDLSSDHFLENFIFSVNLV